MDSRFAALLRLPPPAVVGWARRRRALLRSRRPRTFNEKVVYKIHRDRRSLLVTFADKVDARRYVMAKAPTCGLTTVYAVTADLATVDRATLPRQLVVKASHASGGVLLVADWAPLENRTPQPSDGLCRATVHPDRLDWEQLIETTTSWLRTPYTGPLGEWAYSQVPPRLLLEELLTSDRGQSPTDFKFWVFHGRCRLVEVASDRFGVLGEEFFTTAWETVDDGPSGARSARPTRRPETLDAMIDIAEALGAETDFVRVDLYDVDGRIVFGELTNYPGGGSDAVDTRQLDERLGAHWTVPRRYRDLSDP